MSERLQIEGPKFGRLRDRRLFPSTDQCECYCFHIFCFSLLHSFRLHRSVVWPLSHNCYFLFPITKADVSFWRGQLPTGTLQGLPRFDQPLPEPKPHWDLLPTIDWFWVKVGIKGGLAALISIVCLKWIHPPGPANVPTWAWLLIVLGRSFFRLGGTGDLRAFQTALRGSLILAVCAALLVLTAPFLASYAIMNLALFLLLFTAGFLTARIAGITFWMEFTFLTISQFVALNPQNPVPSQTIIDAFVGMMFGMWIATALSRLLWPVLPQKIAAK